MLAPTPVDDTSRRKMKRSPRREYHGASSRVPRDQQPRWGVCRVAHEDIAVHGVRDLPVAGKPKRRWVARLRAGVCHHQGRSQERDERHGKEPSRQDRRDRLRAREDGHREPPSRERPARALPDPARLRQELISVGRDRAEVQVGKEDGQVLLEPAFGGHAGCPPATVDGPTD